MPVSSACPPDPLLLLEQFLAFAPGTISSFSPLRYFFLLASATFSFVPSCYSDLSLKTLLLPIPNDATFSFSLAPGTISSLDP